MPEEVAVVETKEVSLDTLPQSEFKKARHDGATTVVTQKVETVEEKEETISESNEAAEAKDGEQEKPKSKGGFQKRIDRLIKENAEKDRRLKEYEARDASKAKDPELVSNQENEEESADKTEDKAVDLTNQPQRKDYPNEISFLKAGKQFLENNPPQKHQFSSEAEYIKFVVKNNTSIEQTELAIDRLEKATAKIANAELRHPDFWEKLDKAGKSETKIPDDVLDMVGRLSAKEAVDLVYYLVNDVETLNQMNKVRSEKAVEMAENIILKLNQEDMGDGDDEEEEKQDPKPAAKSKPVSKAPEPVKPIKGGSSKSYVPLDEMSLPDYKKGRASGRVR